MRVRSILRYSVREIIYFRKWILLITLNLSLGLTGLLSIETFGKSLSSFLWKESAKLVGADLVLSSRRPFQEQELSQVQKRLRSGEDLQRGYEVYSMLQVSDQTKLVQVRMIDGRYPFYGTIYLKSGREPAQDKEFRKGEAVWISSDIQNQANLKEDETVLLGGKKFIVSGVIREDSNAGLGSSFLAPILAISDEGLKRSGLISKESVARHQIYLKIRDGEIDERKKELERYFTDPGVRITTASESSEQMARAASNVTDFLGLMSLAGLFFALIGMAYLYRSLLNRRIRTVGVFLALGLKPKQILSLYLFEIFLIGVSASLISYGLSYFLFPGLESVLREFLPSHLAFSMDRSNSILPVLISVMGGIIVCLPGIRSLVSANPAELFYGEKKQFRLRRSEEVVYLFLWGIYFWVLSVVQAKSFERGSLFLGMITGFMIFAYSLYRYIVPRISKVIRLSSLSGKIAIRELSRNIQSSSLIYLSVTVAVFLLVFIIHLEKGLYKQFDLDMSSQTPSMFLFDIQDDQLSKLAEIGEQRGVKIENITPMLQGRILTVNGVAYDRKERSSLETREDEASRRFRNRGVRITYQKSLNDSESLISGRLPVKEDFDWGGGLEAEITVEERYAERQGWKLDDRVTFEVEGFEIPTKIVGIRKVRWTSFLPNFFIVFQAGVFEDAPKTYLATLRQRDVNSRVALQREIVKVMPNISIVDISVLSGKIQTYLQYAVRAIGWMGLLAVFVGLFVLFTIEESRIRDRVRKLEIFRVLGLRFSDVRSSILIEKVFLLGSASILGVAAGFFVADLVLGQYFETEATFLWGRIAGLLLFVSMMILGLVSWIMLRMRRDYARPVR